MRRLRDKPSCVSCRAIYAKKGEEPPCDECIPKLDPANGDALTVWAYVQDQWIMSFGGVVAINLQAVIEVMEILQIANKADCLERVTQLGRAIASDLREQKETK